MTRPEPRRAAVRRPLTAPPGRSSLALAAAGVLLAGMLLTACTPASPDAQPSSAPSSTGSATAGSPSATPTPTPTSTAPALVPDGSASDNLAYFAAIVNAVAAGPDSAAGRAYIDALVAGGFDKSAMQVTKDQSTVGNAAESIQFSVLWSGECLVGQVGPATGPPVAVVLPAVGSGTCLIGSTRPIDW